MSQGLALLTVSAGLHCSFKISKQMLPLLFTFGWYTCRRLTAGSSLDVGQIAASPTPPLNSPIRPHATPQLVLVF